MIFEKFSEGSMIFFQKMRSYVKSTLILLKFNRIVGEQSYRFFFLRFFFEGEDDEGSGKGWWMMGPRVRL